MTKRKAADMEWEEERARLRAALEWAYQAIGARWPNVQALDNLSAVLQGKEPPHEWPVVPPALAAWVAGGKP
jgi:hypothetical protein